MTGKMIDFDINITVFLIYYHRSEWLQNERFRHQIYYVSYQFNTSFNDNNVKHYVGIN